MARFISILICFLLLVLLSSYDLNAAMTSGNYQIWQDAISVGGGENQTSDNYNLGDTLGEFGIGNSSSTNNSARPGFRNSEYAIVSLSVGSSSIDFGGLSTGSTATGSATLSVFTNVSAGISVTYSGSTLTCSSCSGANTITAIGATAVSSSAGTSQFGFNTIYSSGTSPYASSVAPYNSAGQYVFNSGDEIVSSSNPINETIFNINFIANIDGTEPAGIYTTTITYTATANF